MSRNIYTLFIKKYKSKISVRMRVDLRELARLKAKF